MQFGVEVHRGKAARELFEAADFRERLQKLHARCPWSTVFQSLPFLDAWFRHYDASYEPLIVIGRDELGNLAGMVPLAIEKENGKLVVAGTHHAEYQAWLALPELRTQFIEAALENLRGAFPRGTLQFMFVRPDAPLESFRAGGRWHGSSEMRAFPRGLIALGDGSKFRESMKKRHNATQLGGLQKLGTVQFEHVERPEELEAEFDEIVAFNDFRKGATYDKLPFRSDPRKKPFHVALLKIPHLLHASVMRLNGKIISSYIGAIDRDQVIAILLTHSPFVAKYSVGRLHLLSLGMHLAEKGFREYDLTPGGGYKNQYATHSDDVFALTIFFDRAACLRHRVRMRISELGKKVLNRLSLEPERVRETLGGALRGAVRPRTLAGVRSALFETREIKLYAADVERYLNLENPHVMRRDDLNGLMAFQATGAHPSSLQEFLSGAQASLETGHHAYTCVVDGVLVCSGWLAKQLKTLKFGEVGQEWQIPKDGAAIYGIYVQSGRRGGDLLQGALVQMLQDASAVEGAKRAYIPVPAGDTMTSRLLEQMGFAHEASFFQRKKLHRVVRWSTPLRAE